MKKTEDVSKAKKRKIALDAHEILAKARPKEGTEDHEIWLALMQASWSLTSKAFDKSL